MRFSSNIWRAIVLIMTLPLLEGLNNVNAQVETGSPFSAKGLGEIQPSNYARNFGMGGVGIALPGRTGIDPVNPGHYGNMVEPGFDLGVKHDRISMTDGEITEEKKNSQLQNIAFGFPASDRWTLTFGIHPYAQRNYNVQDTLTKDKIGEYARTYTGEGRIQKLYLGNGYNIIQQGDSLRLGIGFHLSYLFGELRKKRRTEFKDRSQFNTRIREELSISEFVLDAGVHFQKRFALHPREGSDGEEMVPLRLMAGLTFDLPKKSSLERNMVAETYTGSISQPNIRDTSTFIQGENTPFEFPMGYGGGIALEYDQRLRGSFEFRTRKWGSINEEASALLFQSDKAVDRRVLRAGFEFTPLTEYRRSSSYLGYWDYRLGFRSIREYYQYKGREVRDLGISFGLGLPLVRSSSFSTIDLGAEWSKRGPKGNGPMLRERAWKFYIGVSLSPHRADQWFRKPKIR